MLATRYDDVFVIPRARQSVAPISRALADLEFSEYGRVPRISPAWVSLGLACFWGAVVALIWA
jgi:hypothetical protein